MNDKKNDLVTQWDASIEAGRQYRKKFSSYDQWPQYRNMYRGLWKGNIIPVNRVFSYGRSLIPQVMFRAPYVTVTPRRPEFIAHAKVMEAVDNWLIRETLLKQTLKSSALEAFLTGTGPIKIGYDSEYGYIPEQAIDTDAATATQYGRKQKRLIEYKTQVKSGMPWALPVQPDDVIVPYGYRYGTDLPWIAHRILRPLDDVRQDQKYSNVKDLKGTRASVIYDQNKVAPPYQMNEILFAELYEIRDVRERRIITLCENEILLNEPDALQTEGLPWEFVIFNPDPEHFWGISDVSILTPQQIELNEVRTQQSRHRKIALLKFLAKKGVISNENIDAFLSGETGPFIEVDDDQITSAIMTLQPHVPAEFSGIIREILSDMRESMGFSENELGAFSPYHGKTATETMQVASSNDNRVNERKDIISDVLVNIVRKFNQIIFKTWTGERVIQIAGQGGLGGWIQYTGQELEGEYFIQIDPESGFPVSKALRAQLAEGLLKQYGGDQLIDQIHLRMQHLDSFEWVFPGVSRSLLNETNPLVAQALSMDRQPTPIGGSGLNSTGQRGGGRVPGSSPENAIPFEKFKKGAQPK